MKPNNHKPEDGRILILDWNDDAAADVGLLVCEAAWWLALPMGEEAPPAPKGCVELDAVDG